MAFRRQTEPLPSGHSCGREKWRVCDPLLRISFETPARSAFQRVTPRRTPQNPAAIEVGLRTIVGDELAVVGPAASVLAYVLLRRR